jgi:hypothetical protein
MVPTYSDEQQAAFRRSEEVIARIRPESLPADRRLCAGCGKIIHRERRTAAGAGVQSSVRRGFATERQSYVIVDTAQRLLDRDLEASDDAGVAASRE